MLSDYLELKLLDHVLKVSAYTVPTNLYLALGTGASETGLTGEPSGNGYARKAHNTWTAASNRAASNNGVIVFNQATGSWGTLSHFGIYDSLTGGNLLLYGTLQTAKAVVQNNTPSFASGTIIPTFDAGGASTHLANVLLNHVLKTSAFSVPTNLYVALSTANPTDAGTAIAEPSGNNYARKVANSWSAAAAGASANSAAITFNEASGAWGNIAYAAIFDAITGGNMLLHSTLTPTQAVVNGDTIQYNVGSFTININ